MSSDVRVKHAPAVTPFTEGPLDWMDWASCAGTDPEAFFPPKGYTAPEAVAICRTCPVRDPCLEFALRSRVYGGIWGGLTYLQRLQLQRKRTA